MNDKILHMVLPTALHDSLKQKAKEKNISLSSLVRIILTDWVNANK